MTIAGRGFVFVDDPEKQHLLPGIETESGRERYSVALFHQLHCLVSIVSFLYIFNVPILTYFIRACYAKHTSTWSLGYLRICSQIPNPYFPKSNIRIIRIIYTTVLTTYVKVSCALAIWLWNRLLSRTMAAELLLMDGVSRINARIGILFGNICLTIIPPITTRILHEITLEYSITTIQVVIWTGRLFLAVAIFSSCEKTLPLANRYSISTITSSKIGLSQIFVESCSIIWYSNIYIYIYIACYITIWVIAGHFLNKNDLVAKTVHGSHPVRWIASFLTLLPAFPYDIHNSPWIYVGLWFWQRIFKQLLEKGMVF